MKPKLLVAVVTLAVLAFALAVTRRATETVSASRPAAQTAVKGVPADLKSHPALASYRVFEEPAQEGSLPFRGANYSAEVRREGMRFQAGEHTISLRARRVEQGGVSVELADGEPVKTRFGAASVERAEGIAEEFVFENRRAEHLVRVDRPVGEGALVVRVAVETSLTGQVQQVGRGDSSWKDTTVADGGLIFTDAAGKPGLAYHGAVAVDAAGRRQLFDPRWENGEIALEVPASFMKDAAYPVLIDPWLELNFSASGSGISLTGSVSETPAITLISGASPAVAWSDASDGDFDIYFRYWNGEAWIALGPANANVSTNVGKSTNPSIGYFTPTNTTLFHPFIAWEDDTEGTTNIYAKFWTGSNWSPLGGSADSSGVSLSIGVPCRNPQAVGVTGLVDNLQIVTTPPTLNQKPDRVETFPCIVWEREGVGIESRFFYPGDDRNPPGTANWYTHPSGRFLSGSASAARPTAVVTSTNILAVAWEESVGGEFDILARRTSISGTYAINMASGTASPTILIGTTPTASNWAAVGSGNVCTDVGAAVALSIQPSLTVDANNALWVAWQESVGVEREIYVASSAGFGNWAGVGGSASAGGISGTSTLGINTTSSFPSIAVDPVDTSPRPVVAWEDDAGGNSEIYVRRLNTGTNTWDQIADEGSAMLVAPETTGNNGGISRTSSFSLRPKAIVAPGGGASVAWRDGAGGTFDLLLRRYHDNQPTTLSQASVAAGVPSTLFTGGLSVSVDVQFSAILVAETSSLPTLLRLQVEVRPITSDFTGQVTHESLEVGTGATATILFTGLPNVNYHWRARSIDSAGRSSPWISFGGNADGTTDFRIDSNAVVSGPGSGSSSGGPTEHKDKCGLLGLEALALIGVAAFARRRRKA